MLAQFQIDAMQWFAWCGCAAAATFLLNQGAAFIDRFRSKPPGEQLKQSTDALEKRLSAVEAEMVPQKLCNECHKHLDERLASMERSLLEFRKEVREDRERSNKSTLIEVGKVHNRVNDVLEAVSELRGQVHQMESK